MKKLKELMKNPQYSALVKLGLYLAFFVIVFVILNLSTKNVTVTPPIVDSEEVEEEVLTSIDKLKLDVSYTLNINNNLITVNESVYTYMNKQYTIDEIKQLFLILKTEDLFNILSNATIISSNYIDNYDTYVINYSDFNKIILNEDSDEEEVLDENSVEQPLTEEVEEIKLYLYVYKNEIDEITSITVNLLDILGYDIIYLKD